jgi:hypothetical protein
MSKGKVTLSGRPRTKELQKKNQLESSCVADIKKAEILKLQGKESDTKKTSVLGDKKELEQIVSILAEKYRMWAQPVDRNRYRYSPNRRSEMLLSEIRVLLNDMAYKLVSEGCLEVECRKCCQSFLDNLMIGLRAADIPVGNIYLSQKRVS